MKQDELLQFPQAVLVGAVKLAQRKQLTDGDGKDWKEWVEAQPGSKKLSDPRRYTPEQLAAFLHSLKGQRPLPAARRPAAAAAGGASRGKAARVRSSASEADAAVKPQKLLKRYLPWLAGRIHQQQHQQQQAAAGGRGKPTKAAAGTASEKAAAPAKVDRVWQLVSRTRAHPRYHPAYSFESWAKGWVVTDRPADERAAGPPWQLLAIDCEMCATADNEKELLQVAVVDEHGTTLMKELVLPPSKVLDFRTELTGVTAADLEGVTLTRKGAAKRIAALLGPASVLVGHSLHYDLAALQLDHGLVIDTSLIFGLQGLASATPSLMLLAEQLLGRQLRGRGEAAAGGSAGQGQQPAAAPHDSVEDASTSLALVQMELQRDAPTPPLEPPPVKVDKADLAKLCVHKLPASAAAGKSAGDAVKASLAAACRAAGQDAAAAAIEGAEVEQPHSSSTGGSGGAAQQQQQQQQQQRLLFLVFPHAGVANDVFAALPGAVFRDSVGRHSKAQALQGSSHKVLVRKMACHGGLAFGKDATQDRGAPKKQQQQQQQNKKKDGKPKQQAAAGGGGGGAAAGGAKRKAGEAHDAAAAGGEQAGSEAPKKQKKSKKQREA